MVVAETIAIIEGIGLVTKSVSHIKGILKSKDADASQVAGHIDSLFNGHTQIEKKAKATSIVSSKWNALLKHRLGETADPNSIQSIATLKIQQRLADEEIIKVRRMINRRWPGAWDEILHERQERIKKAKSARVKKREEDKEKWNSLLVICRNMLLLFIGLGAIVMYVVSKAK